MSGDPGPVPSSQPPDLPAGPDTDCRRPLRLGAGLLAAGLGALILWSMLAPLDEGVPAQGVVTVEGSRKRVEHLSGGIVGQVLVREGQQVSAGQDLVRLEATQARTALGQTQAQWAAALALQARLVAERDGADKVDFPAALKDLASRDPEVAALLRSQEGLFRSRQQALRGSLRIIAESVRGLEAQLVSLARLRQGRERQVSLFNERLESFMRLKDEGFISRHYLLEVERELAEIQSRQSEDLSNIAGVEARLADFRLRGQQAEVEFRRDVESQLADIRQELASLEERLIAQRDTLARMVVTAPVKGTVIDLAVHAVGEVVQPGGRLLDIVPAGERLMVEAKAEPRYVDRLRPGLSVQVYIDAYANRANRPVLEGVVEVVSADALPDPQSGAPHYTIRVGLAQPSGPAAIRLVPGMQASVLVRTGERPLIVYLLRPLLRRFDAALKE